jgi:hypothetical protein
MHADKWPEERRFWPLPAEPHKWEDTKKSLYFEPDVEANRNPLKGVDTDPVSL